MLWSRHYREVAGISRSNPSLPGYLGGLEIAVGRPLTIFDPVMERNFLPYYYGMLLEPDQKSFLFSLELLLGIWRTSGKGFPYEPTDEQLLKVFEKVKILPSVDVMALLPSYASTWTFNAKREILDRMLGFIPLSQIGNEMVRRDAFLQWWLGKKPPKAQSMMLDPKRFGAKHRDAWDKIRLLVSPAEKPFDVHNLRQLAQKIESRCHNQFFNREDPAFAEAFLNMPSLYVRLKN